MPKPRFSQIGALVFPKENVSLGIFDMLGGSAYEKILTIQYGDDNVNLITRKL